MGKQIELDQNVSEALRHYKANLYMSSASLIPDQEVVNRILKRFLTEDGLGFCFEEEVF